LIPPGALNFGKSYGGIAAPLSRQKSGAGYLPTPEQAPLKDGWRFFGVWNGAGDASSRYAGGPLCAAAA
jgi:hypothetical protein